MNSYVGGEPKASNCIAAPASLNAICSRRNPRTTLIERGYQVSISRSFCGSRRRCPCNAPHLLGWNSGLQGSSPLLLLNGERCSGQAIMPIDVTLPQNRVRLIFREASGCDGS